MVNGIRLATISAGISTPAAYQKIHIPDFTGIILGQLKGAVIDTWHKIPLHSSPFLLPGLMIIGGIILIIIIRWVFINFVR